jgi:hypothetical protein
LANFKYQGEKAKMSDSEFPDSSVPVERDKPAMTDSDQAELEPPQLKPEQVYMAGKKRRWALVVGSIL